MAKFRQKEYSIKEGHYTGPKDMEKMPSTLSEIAKGAGAGALAGAVIGTVFKGDKEGSLNGWSGAKSGAGMGLVASLAIKVLCNIINNPMKSVKFQDVDKQLRQSFGMYRAAGIAIGDSVSSRSSFDEKFSTNDRNVTDYKLTFCISEGKLTMYTFGLSDKELDQVDRILDYYCKTYYGMEYSSSCISQKNNSYAVTIVFTNNIVISRFILELSNSLETKINLLDNNSVAKLRFSEAAESEEDNRNFSLADNFDNSDVFGILANTGMRMFDLKLMSNNSKMTLSFLVISLIQSVLQKLNERELAKSKIPCPRCLFSNAVLKDTLKKLRYIEGFHYTVKDKSAKTNISLNRGLLVITTEKGSEDNKSIDEKFWNKVKGNVRRSEVNGKVVVYSYSIMTKSEFELYLKLLMSTGIVFNIFE